MMACSAFLKRDSSGELVLISYEIMFGTVDGYWGILSLVGVNRNIVGIQNLPRISSINRNADMPAVFTSGVSRRICAFILEQA